MAIGKDGAVRRQLRTLFNVGTVRELTDGQLLERFATDRGEAAELAFAVLVERHGPMVMRVCLAVLGDSHDAQDAFQATFLVLVKRAAGAVGARFDRSLAAPGGLPDRDVRPDDRGPPPPPRTTRGDDRPGVPARAGLRAGAAAARGDRPAARALSRHRRPLRPGRPHLRTGGATPRLAGGYDQEPALPGPRAPPPRAAPPRRGHRCGRLHRGPGVEGPGLLHPPCPAGYHGCRRVTIRHDRSGRPGIGRFTCPGSPSNHVDDAMVESGHGPDGRLCDGLGRGMAGPGGSAGNTNPCRQAR